MINTGGFVEWVRREIELLHAVARLINSALLCATGTKSMFMLAYPTRATDIRFRSLFFGAKSEWNGWNDSNKNVYEEEEEEISAHNANGELLGMRESTVAARI